ncbi:MAG: DNA-directed RNA polymerase subunit omega [Lachnospiraceae bacterium]|nr:DNA-directed RNA polymerase subunit omega [Lachnospiraceae bacterium]
MLHPSYSDLMKVVNSEVDEGEHPVVNSRYSIVMATAKRARQLIDDAPTPIEDAMDKKPLSVAVEELNEGIIKVLSEEEAEAAKQAQEALTEEQEPDEETE